MKKNLKLFGLVLCQSHRKYMSKYDLDWEQKLIIILGITFSADLCNIWEHNADDIIHKIKRMINTWSKRKLTLPGKITLIKSIMLAKGSLTLAYGFQ